MEVSNCSNQFEEINISKKEENLESVIIEIDNNSSGKTHNVEEPVQTYSFLDIEEFLKNDKIPPGIKEYDDLPGLDPVKASESKIEKQKKPWENDENIQKLDFTKNEIEK